MSEIYVYLILFVLAVIILNSNFSLGAKPITKNQTENLSVIEHLTQYTTKQKNYRRTPRNFSSFGYAVHGRIVEEDVFLD
jgi:hypothetical protein